MCTGHVTESETSKGNLIENQCGVTLGLRRGGAGTKVKMCVFFGQHVMLYMHCTVYKEYQHSNSDAVFAGS